MFIVGFIQLARPRVLINPVSCATVEELYNWLCAFLNPEDFKQDPVLTMDGLHKALSANVPVRVNFSGYEVGLLLGHAEVVYEATDSFKHAEALTEALKQRNEK